MLELPLDLNGATVEENEGLVFCGREEFSWCESDMMREGAAATLFTEGELPYQCICCHLLHCFSGVVPLSLSLRNSQSDFYPHMSHR